MIGPAVATCSTDQGSKTVGGIVWKNCRHKGCGACLSIYNYSGDLAKVTLERCGFKTKLPRVSFLI